MIAFFFCRCCCCYICMCAFVSITVMLRISLWAYMWKILWKKKKKNYITYTQRKKKKKKKKGAVVIYIYLNISISSYVHLFQKKKPFVILKRKAKKLFFLFSAFSRKRKRSAHSWVSFFKKASCKTVCITPPLSVQPMKTKDRYCEHHWWKRSSR